MLSLKIGAPVRGHQRASGSLVIHEIQQLGKLKLSNTCATILMTILAVLGNPQAESQQVPCR